MRRLTNSTFLLIAIATACITLGPASIRCATAPGRRASRDAHHALALRASATASTPALGIASPSQWRHRIKSVLEEKDVRAFQPVDLGPAHSPDRTTASHPCERGPIFSLRLIPLRC